MLRLSAARALGRSAPNSNDDICQVAGLSRRAVLGAALSPLVADAWSPARTIQPTVEAERATIEPGEDGRLRVLLAAGGEPMLLFKPAHGVWDWSKTSRLAIPVDNEGDAPLTLTLRVEDAAWQSLAGAIAIAPRTARQLTIWLAAPPPRSLGMVAGPSLAAAGLDPRTLPVTATRGVVDTARISAVRLSVWRPLVPTRLVVGPLHAAALGAQERNAYADIVDGLGQYRRGRWPEKVSLVAMLRAVNRDAAPATAPLLERDRFGGLEGAGRFAATGLFRTERQNDRWWLVTPDGHAFFSLGIDVVAPSGATYVEGREFMFRDLPARDGPLAAHWSRRDDRLGLGAQRGRRFDHGWAFDFRTANLERKFGAEWRRRWREEASARLESWGFNTIGNWSEPGLWAMHRLPYVVPLDPEAGYATVSSGADWWGPMPDPFDPKFAAAVDSMAREAAARFAADPYLVGYFVQNELSWGNAVSKDPRRRYSIAVGALAAGPESRAKAALMAQLGRTYGSPERLGQAWGISLASWHELRRAGLALAPASLDRPPVQRDFAAFTAAFAEAYFRTVGEAMRRHDPHHLYLGCRFAGAPPEAVAAAARWCDVVSFNLYQRSIADDPERWAQFRKLGKPALIGEFHFGSVDRGLFWEGVIGAGNESERGPAYARYLEAVAANPDFVGAHWFAYADEPLTGRTLDGENGHIGFVSVADVPYRGLVRAARTANAAALHRLRTQL
jgi:Beta-galactosidase